MAKDLISIRSWIDIVFAYVLLALCIMMVKYLDQSSLLAIVSLVGALWISFDGFKPVNEWPTLYQLVYHRIQKLREKTRIGGGNDDVSGASTADVVEPPQADVSEAPQEDVGENPKALGTPEPQQSLFDDDTGSAPRPKKQIAKAQRSPAAADPNSQQLPLRLPLLIKDIDIEADGDLYTTDQLAIIDYAKELNGKPPQFEQHYFDLPDCVRDFIVERIRETYTSDSGEVDSTTLDQLIALSRVVEAEQARLSGSDADEFISDGLSFSCAVARKIRAGSYGPLVKKFAQLQPLSWTL